MRLVLSEIFNSIEWVLPTKKTEARTEFSIFAHISFFSEFAAISPEFPWIKVIFRCESLQKLWSIYKNLWNIIQKFDLARFTLFFDQNVDQSCFMRQQAITLMFLLVIEDIKIYHPEYLKVVALRKSQAPFPKFGERSY